jgi:DNA polymerase III epsilon subunit-like protein
MIAVVCDFETTGLVLHPNAKMGLQPKAIEWGAVKIDHEGNVLDEQTFIVDPGIEIDEVITKITGLTNDDLRGKPRMRDKLCDIADFMRDADILCAHNLPFDREILDMEIVRAQYPDFPWPRFALCTAQLYAEIWGRRPRLLELYEWSTGQPLAQTHRAIDDVRALVEIVIKERLVQLYAGRAS